MTLVHLKNQQTLSFEKLTAAHLPLLYSWLNSSHLKGLYDNGYSSIEEVKSKYLNDQKEVSRFIVFDKEQPFGYIQSYKINATHEYARYSRPEGLTAGIDLFIGEESFLKKGFGSLILQQFIASLESGIERIIVDPCATNSSSMALFQKYGFQKLDEFFREERKHCLLGINIRKAVRGVIINPLNKVLLICMKADPLKEDQKELSTFWLTPGGKVEGTENYEEALVREIREEVGFTEIQMERILFSDEWVDIWHQFPLRLFNRYYLVRSQEVDFTNQYLMEDERDVVLGYKWWSLQELLTTQEIVFPRFLANELEHILCLKKVKVSG